MWIIVEIAVFLGLGVFLVLAGALYSLWWAVPYALMLAGIGAIALAIAGSVPWWSALIGGAFVLRGANMIYNRKHKAHLVKKQHAAQQEGLYKISAADKIASGRLRPPQFVSPIAEQIGEIAKGVFTVQLFTGHGSGFFITGGGLAVTNQHVVSQDDFFDVKQIGKDASLIGRRLVTAENLDAALVAVALDESRPLRINPELPKVGEDVYAYGTPLDQSLEGTLTRGVVSAIRSEDNAKMIQSDVSILPGNSGGPLLDKWGNVVGISTEIIQAGEQHTSICRFIPIAEALRRLGFDLKQTE